MGPGAVRANGMAVVAAGEGEQAEPQARRAWSSAMAAAAELVAGWLETERERWFHWVPVAFSVGVACYFQLAQEPSILGATALLPVAVVLRALWRKGTLAVFVTGALLAASLGFALAKLRTEWVRAPVLARPMIYVPLTGYVELVEPRATRGQRITVRVITLGSLGPDARPIRARVRTLAKLEGLRPGDAIRLRATLAGPAPPTLPGGYDFARQAWFAGIGAVGYALARPQIEEGAGPPPLMLQVWAAVERVRQAIGQRVAAALPGETGAIATALITGERGGISEATNDAYKSSGLLHILSISGLHMVIMAGAVFFAVRLLLAAVPAIALRYPIKKWAAVAAALGALGYLLISGTAFATVRSYIMISIMFLSMLLDRPALALRNVALAALLILLLYPESLFDVGFQMSFAAVIGLVSVYEAIRARVDEREGAKRGALFNLLMFFAGIVLSTLIASLAVAPFGIYHFHQSQQFAILSNLIAIPVCNVIVMPAALATLVLMPLGLEALPLWVMGLGVDLMTWCARLVGGLPGSVSRVPAIPVTAFLLMVCGGLWLALWTTRARLMGIAGIILGIGLASTGEQPDVLVARDGKLVAMRGPDGRLSALAAPQSSFEMTRWLESDGDSRTARDAAKGEGFRCDATGCLAEVKGVTLAIARHPAALIDDCARSRILVIGMPRPKWCTQPDRVIDLFALRDGGTHALYIGREGQLRVETVAAARGNRPWSPAPKREGQARAYAAQNAERARIAAFAAPRELVEGAPPERPEVEDDERSGNVQDTGDPDQ